MAAEREYELVLMLDPGQDAPARDAIAGEARSQIESGGAIKHENVWGLRKLAYEIGHRTEADYRWFRFEASSDVLRELDHNLKIADGVLRFRIFKVDPDAPVMVPPAGAAPGPGTGRERSEGHRGGRPAPAPAEPAPAPAEPAPAATEPAPAAAEPAADASE